MTKEKNPQNQRTGISLFLGNRKPRASHIPTARLLLLHSLHRPSKAQNQNGITRYLPDLPTDSSEEAILESINLPPLALPLIQSGHALVDGGLLNNVPA